jgi:ligand-binding sensor domain-containing protein
VRAIFTAGATLFSVIFGALNIFMNHNKIITGIVCLLLCSLGALGQGRPIGFWRSHLPNNVAVGIATDGSVLYTATELAMFTLTLSDLVTGTYSKAEGMSDVQMSCIGYDAYTGMTVLAYQNGNIDLFRDNTFYNIPDLKLRAVSGPKTIHHIFTEHGYAFLSTSIGVIVIDIERREIKETYTFSQDGRMIHATGFTAMGDHYYVSTNSGIYRTPRNNPNPQLPSSWELMGSGTDLRSIAAVQNKIFAAGTDTVFALTGGALQPVFDADSTVLHIDAGKDRLWVSVFRDGFSEVFGLDPVSYEATLHITGGYIMQVLELEDGTLWMADAYNGLAKRNAQGRQDVIRPHGPRWYGSYGIYAENEEVWVAHGSHNDIYQPQDNPYGFSRYRSLEWVSFDGYRYPPFIDSIRDFVTVVKNPVDGALWAGSLSTGLFILYPDESYELLYHGSVLRAKPREPDMIPVNSITPDDKGNMWVTQHATPQELAVRTKSGSWYHFSTPYGRNIPHSAAGLLIDNAGQKWFHAVNGPSMVIVYDDNNTIENAADDRSRSFGSAENIPGTKVLSMAKDRDGVIWVGTDNGIARISCPEQAFQSNCMPELPKVQYDQFVGYLFAEEQVNTIAVDGANRKWVGTNNGVWLVSPDGDEIVYRFTAENSPLPSNGIRKIVLDGVTGDVYIGTDLGLVSFRSTATEGNEEDSKIVAYPNPVPTGYKGTIGIRGLTENADVRITDISGQLIYRTKALGGQAVWNGKDYTGRRPQSGVYLIFATSADGSQTNTGKMVFME